MDGAAIPTAALRSALVFAVDVALLHSQKRPPLPYPLALRPLLKLPHRQHTARTLQTVRAALDGDPQFRAAVAALARAELVNAVGMTYLHGDEDWADRVAASGVEAGGVAGDSLAELAAERRRRAAAEAALARLTSSTEVELARLRADSDEAIRRTDQALAEAVIERDEARAELIASRDLFDRHMAELEEASGRSAELEGEVAGLTEQVRQLRLQLDEVGAAFDEAEAARDAVLAERSAEHARAAAQAQPARTAYGVVQPLHRPRQRQPIALPGGVLGDSRAAAEFLLRTQDALVIVDGYNVAMLGWPDSDLQEQRERTIQRLEDIARRWGTDVVVIFDGTATTGASARSRRLIHVEYAIDEKADPAIVRRVADTTIERPVVVVTNDRQIIAEVRRLGANSLASEALLDAARR